TNLERGRGDSCLIREIRVKRLVGVWRFACDLIRRDLKVSALSRKIPFLNSPMHYARMRIQMLLAVLLAGCVSGWAEVKPLYKLSKPEQEERIGGDLKAVMIYRQGLEAATKFALQQTNLFPAAGQAPPSLPHRDEKEVVWDTWQCYLD